MTPVSDAETPGAFVAKNDPTPTLHALVIGIDAYLHQPPLAGATSDAEKISDFLINDLGTPPSQIMYLLDAQATREEVIRAIQALQSNPKIKRGDPVLIYFAGHGGVTDASPEWKARHKGASKIQVIFPYDYYESRNGEKVNCIPDKTIAYLLNELAAAKGDNITVIFDSCHSASGSRVSTAGDRQARAAMVKLAIPVDIDDHIHVPTSPANTAPRYLGSPFSTHQASHIHLAACGSNEHAWEEEGRGVFTAALLKTIRAHGVDKVTYQNVIVGLPYLVKQTPHCYGAHKCRTLFNGGVPSRRIAYIPVSYDPEKFTLTLQAGVASGVTHGSIWELQKHAVLGTEGVLGTATAVSVGVSSTELETTAKGDDKFRKLCASGAPCADPGAKIKLYARLVKSGLVNELKVWFSPEAKRLIFPGPKNEDLQAPNKVTPEFGYVVHPAPDSADMLVSVYDPIEQCSVSLPGSSGGTSLRPEPEVQFILCDDYAKRLGIATLPRREPARLDEVETILFAAAQWNWGLQHTNVSNTSSLVEMEMFKIAERRKVDGRYSDTHWEAVPESERVNMSHTGIVDFEVHEKNLYAIRLKSAVDKPLYVRMFYFDISTFCIDDLFGHDAADGRADSVIAPYGEFIIGDDAEGGTPLPFELEPNHRVDMGYMKVFWSTEPLELDHLGQDSVFDTKKGRHGGMVKPLQTPNLAIGWGTTTLVLVQRRPSSKE